MFISSERSRTDLRITAIDQAIRLPISSYRDTYSIVKDAEHIFKFITKDYVEPKKEKPVKTDSKQKVTPAK